MSSNPEPHFTDPHLSSHPSSSPKDPEENSHNTDIIDVPKDTDLPHINDEEPVTTLNPEERLNRFQFRLKIFNIAFILLVVFLIYDALTTLSPFQLRTVNIQGLEQLSEEMILEQIQLDQLKPSIIRPKFHDIEQAALSHPWIRKAEATITLNGTLNLHIQEYKATAIAVLDELKAVSAEGIPFATVSPSEIGDLPLISGIDPEMFKSSQKAMYIGQYWLTQGIELARLVRQSRLSDTKRLSDIHISQTGRYEIMLDKIRISLGVDMLKDRLAEVEKIMDNLDRKGVTAAYILLSDDLNRAIVKEIPITADDSDPTVTPSP